MHLRYTFIYTLLFFWSASMLWSQGSFEFSKNRVKDKVQFKLINNLILVPVQVNGVELTFLLDTGAASTVIFSFEETDSLRLYNYKAIQLRGLGKGEPVDALKSEGNTIQIGKAKSDHQTIYVVFEGALNFSSRLGYPVHGILGASFLDNFVVEINNAREFMRFTLPNHYKKPRCRKCVEKAIEIKNNKPYLTASYIQDTLKMDINLLIDSGSGDGLWLFENSDERIQIPENAFEDYLGLGINGDIFGKRSKVNAFFLNKLKLKNVNTSYPAIEFDSLFQTHLKRHGSLGGEILKRFNWTIDYTHKTLLLKRNRFFKDPFHYNMSGITLQQGGFTLVRTPSKAPNDIYGINQKESFNIFNLNLGASAALKLQQLYEVVAVRPNSPAALAGIRVGDQILEVNNKPAYQFELHQINELFYEKEGNTLRLKIQRAGVVQRIKFTLKDL